MDAHRQIKGCWHSAIASLVVIGTAMFFWQAATPSAFELFAKEFTSAYAEMDPDPYVLEFKDRLRNIPAHNELLDRQHFFNQQKIRLAQFDTEKLPKEKHREAALIGYMVDRHQKQIELELAWSEAGRPTPERGLEGMPMKDQWYQWLIGRFTSTSITPAEVKAMGQQEIDRCKQQLQKLAEQLGFTDEEMFQQELRSERFLIRDKDLLLAEFERVDSTVRSHLPAFVNVEDIAQVHAMEWPGAGRNTPPGIYLPQEHNAYGADVFQFNFHDRTFNSRAIGWLYLHEAIPGHHLQFTQRRKAPHTDLRAHLTEGGNFEGWACYVEYHGDTLGLYNDPWQEVGKWEWDLVRSVRLVLDVGIHNEGWTRDEALRFWRETIPGQDAIAEREVDRVTAMPGQVLSYKVGAAKIEELKNRMQQLEAENFDLKEFHRKFLDAGQCPLEIIDLYLIGTGT